MERLVLRGVRFSGEQMIARPTAVAGMVRFSMRNEAHGRATAADSDYASPGRPAESAPGMQLVMARGSLASKHGEIE
jgi:hypothetical protein